MGLCYFAALRVPTHDRPHENLTFAIGTVARCGGSIDHMRPASSRPSAALRFATLLSVLLLTTGVPLVVHAAEAPAPAVRIPPLGATFSRDFDELISWRSARVLAVGAALSAASARVENADTQADWFGEPSVDGTSDFGNTYGSASTLVAGSVAVMLAGKLGGSQELLDLGFDTSRALLYSGTMVWALKTTVRRTRPNGGAYSFPSGHTAAAFSIAPVLAHRYGWRVGVPAFALATATGMGRMEDRYHYLSDVVFGASIGLAVGEAVAASGRRAGMLEHLALSPTGVVWSTTF
jgi:membrane-associated phospholipid phosphatase